MWGEFERVRSVKDEDEGRRGIGRRMDGEVALAIRMMGCGALLDFASLWIWLMTMGREEGSVLP